MPSTYNFFKVELIAKIKNSTFFKNGLTLSGGVALAQVLPFLFYPVLGRIYTADQFGLLASITSIITVLSVVGSGRYEAALVVVEERLQAAHLALLAVMLGLGSMLLCEFLSLWVLPSAVGSWFKSAAVGDWLWVCPLAAFFVIVFNVYNEWCVRAARFKALATNKIVNSGAIVLNKTLFGFVKVSSQGLVVGDLIGRFVSAAGCAVRAWLKGRDVFSQTRWAGIRSCAVDYKEYPLYNMPGRLLNSIGQALPVLFVAAYFGDTEAGYFSMAMALFSVPINIVSTSVGDVYRQRAAEEYREKGECWASFKKVMWSLTAIGVGAFLMLEWFLPSLTRLFLGGEEWRLAGVYAQIIAPAMVVMFVSNSLSGMFVVADRQRDFFFWQLYFAVTTLAAVWIGGELLGSVKATLVLFSVLRCSAYLLSIVLTSRYAFGK